MTSLREYVRSFSNEPDLQLILLVQTAYRIAMGLVAVFIPVFLYQQGISVGAILLFYWLRCFFVVLIAPGAALVLDRTGTAMTIMLSLPFMVVAYALIGHVTTIGLLFVIVPMLLSVHDILYNSAVHYTIIPALTVNDSGKQLATLSMISEAGRYIAPVVAGGIAAFFGFATLFVIAASIVAVSALPLFVVDLDAKKRTIDGMGDFVSEMSITWRSPERVGSFAGYAIPQSINAVVWPVFVTVFVGGLVDLGVITTVSALIGMALVYVLGLGSDRGQEGRSLWWMSGLYAVVYAARTVAATPLVATIIESIRRPLYKGTLIPWKKQSSTIAKREHTLAFIVAREMTYKGIRVLVLPLFMVAFAHGLSLSLGLIIGGAFLLLLPVIDYEYSDLERAAETT